MEMPHRLRRWTLAELHALPNDGNRYELIRGELVVTPAPGPDHETVLVNLTDALWSYVHRHALGSIHSPHSVIMNGEEQVEPDRMVRKTSPLNTPWPSQPLPILVIEATSPSSRRDDFVRKREIYLRLGIPEYWILDVQAHVVRVCKPDESKSAMSFAGTPAGVDEILAIDVQALFA